jgi:hypothetical protein
MQVRLGAAVVAIAALSATSAHTENALVCEREMTRAAALKWRPAQRPLFRSPTETGRKSELSPYDGKDFPPRSPRRWRVLPEQTRTAPSSSIGYMQINHHWHAAEFGSLDGMFDPARNVEFAAKFLKTLHTEEGS